MKELAMVYRIKVVLISLALLTMTSLSNVQAQSDERCFPETGFCIAGRFREYWESNGGLSIFGFPITPQQEEMVEGKPLQVQWFERNRFELHPENARPYDVLLGRLGVTSLEIDRQDWTAFPTATPLPECRYFAETQHNICGDILTYWRANGLEFDGQEGKTEAESIALFGLPLSEILTVTIEGQSYNIQWFERARFELHPENAPPYNVLLGLLGSHVLQALQAICIDFEEPPWALGTQYGDPVGQVPGNIAFTSGGVRILVQPFEFSGDGGTFNYAQIDDAPISFSAGQSLRLNHINVEFDFNTIGFSPSQVSLDFLDLGGTENLAVNGNPSFIDDIARAPSLMAGVAVSVNVTPIPRGKSGTVMLNGPIQSFSIGGQEFWIDHVCISP